MAAEERAIPRMDFADGSQPATDASQRPNVLLLTVDALRADHLGCYGYRRATSPFLDRLAARSSVFTDAYSVSCHTREALPSLLTGHRPAAPFWSDSCPSRTSTGSREGFRNTGT